MTEKLTIKFQGKIFDDNLDLRDIAFFSKKISNITDKAYSAYTGKNSDLKDKYKIITKNINHSCIELDLLLDYGLAISPVLMESHTTVLETAYKAIEAIAKLGDTFKKDDKVSLNAENSTLTTVVVGNNNNVTFNIPAPAYQAMLNMDGDIKDINKKIQSGDIKNFIANDNIYMDSNNSASISRGLDFVNQLKEEVLKDIYKAELAIYEFNKNSLTGKARIISHNMFGIEVKENIDLHIPDNCIDDVINAMSKEKISVSFEPIIENIISKKTLKKIIVKTCKE